jgi:hypothetical protein
VKSLVDKSAFESVTDECLHLKNFCVVMEQILSHKLQGDEGILDHSFQGQESHMRLLQITSISASNLPVNF